MTLEQAIALLIAREYTIEDLSGDPLLAERVSIARQYARTAAWVAIAQATLKAAQEAGSGEKAEALFAGPIAEGVKEVNRLGDRLLMLSAAPSIAQLVH